MVSSLLALLLLTADPLEAERFTVGLPADLELVGLAAGVRPELLYAPLGADAASRLRLAVGILPGPEQFSLPVDLGYRAIYRQGSVVRPIAGGGLMLQQYFVSDGETVRRLALYGEGGVGFAFAERWEAGGLAALSLAPLGEPGPGLSLRAYVSLRL